MMWYAIMDTGETIASGETYRNVSDKAHKAVPWGNGPEGGVAPYIITTCKPKNYGDSITARNILETE